MKKKYILLSGIMGLSLILPISYNISSNYKNDSTKLVSADEITEAEYEVVDIADLTSPYANNGSVFDKTTNGFSKIMSLF